MKHLICLLAFCLSSWQMLTAQEPEPPNPTAGMTFVAPPRANNQGSAVLQYPLNLPLGRQGMQPDLVVDYNSDRPNGWLGLGWDLSLPAITIDTRWGVPRYSNTNETESYFYDGQPLFPLAHRGAVRPRLAEQPFYPRIEGAYDDIIRHGAAPADYWWEVTAKDGTRFYYGGTPEQGVLPGATLATPAGAIVHWALVAVVDTDDNTMRYTYTKVAAAGNNSTQLGQELYPAGINYTGHGTTAGAYSVKFVRDRELGEPLRPDVGIDCRLGFKRVQADLLRRVEIYYQQELVRAYRLEYRAGAFQKTLLQRIVEENRAGADFYAHDFDYYDDVRQNGNYVPFAAEQAWTIPDDNILGSILNPISGMNGETSAIGGAASDNFNVGGAATVGLNDFQLFSKDKTAGGTYAYGNSSDEGLIALVDINSDGLVDKVYRKGEVLRYRPSLARAGSGETRFGDERPIHGITQFSTSTTSSNAFGAEGNPPFAYVGFEYTNSTATNNTYFSDFNGDGLLDIAQNGQVWFNHLDDNGDPVFTTNSGDTPSPISAGAAVDGELFVIDPAELEAAIDQYPLQDVVRMWQAPVAGTIQVVAPVQLVEPTDPLALSYQLDDGVRVAIQFNNTELWSADITADDFTLLTPTGINTLTVAPGDRLYFRVQSVFDGLNDQVSWSPAIDYLSFADDIDLEQRDANNLLIRHYQASEDFVLAARQEVGLPLNGSIRITGLLSKQPTSDDLVVEILRWQAGTSSVVWQDTLPADTLVSMPVDLDLDVLAEDALSFHFRSTTQIDWQAVDWVPNVFYTTSPDAAVVDQFGDPIFSFCPTIDCSMYNQIWTVGQPTTVGDSTTYRVKPLLTFTDPNQLNDSPVTFSVKGPGILYKMTFPVNNYQAVDSLLVPLASGDRVFVEYHFADWAMAQLADTVRFSVRAVTDTLLTASTYPAGYASVIAPDEVIFGHLYRGWGQFEYNGNRDRANLPINQAELLLQEPETDPNEEIPDDPDQLGGLFDPTTAPFLVMLPDAKTQCFLGYDQYTFISAAVVSSSRLGEDNLQPQAPASNSGLGLSAPNRTTKTNEYSIAGGLGFSVLTGTASKSWVDTEVTMDVMDFNGDRYPDIIAGSAIQYTSDQGGYLPGLVAHNIPGHHAAKSEATGFTLGGSFVPSRTSNSGEPKGDSSNKRAAKAKRRSGKLGKNAKNGGNTAGDAIGINGTFSEDGDHAVHSWGDINGDGLVDKIREDGQAALNYGYSFGPFEPWGFTQIQAGESVDFGGGLGLSLYNGSIAGGISLTRTDNFTTQTLEDVNADGLPDMVSLGDQTTVQLNTGTGFGSPISWSGMPQIDEGSATGESVNAAFTVCIPIFFVKICINPSSSIGRGVSRQLRQLEDADGDGFPDLLRSASDGELLVQRSTIGRTNLLQSVARPFGVAFTLDYAPQGTTYEQPYAIWTLDRVEMVDGLADDAAGRTRTIFSYAGGQHDRHERAFYGFSSVKETAVDPTSDAPYRSYTQLFANDNYYNQGLLTAETWQDAEAKLLRRIRYTYELRAAETGVPLLPVQLNNAGLRVFPALVQQAESWFDANGTVGLTATRTYDYDTYANLTRTRDLGAGDPEELLDITFSYHYLPEAHIFTVRDSVTVRDANGIVRQRTSQVDEGGDVLQLRHYLDGTVVASYDYTYDEYGNTTSIIQPANVNGERLRFDYTYDAATHTFATAERDVFGQVLERRYDPRYGEPQYYRDEQGLEATTELDEFGRTSSRLLAADQEAGSDYSFRYTYAVQDGRPRLQVDRYDPEYNAPYTTYVFADGNGRIRQEQSTTEATVAAAAAASTQFQVTGKTERDAFGRSAAIYYPRLLVSAAAGTYQAQPDAVPPTQISYDELDRPRLLTTPDGEEYTLSYDFAATPSGILGQQTTIKDPLAQEKRLIYDTRGQLLAEATSGPDGLIWSEYRYNAVAEKVAVTDAAGVETRYTYDGRGRLVKLVHPDGGVYDYTYDPAGNLLSQVTPAIRARNVAGAQINYFYDFDRLQRIEYPFNPQNQVRYTWGDSTATAFRNGRVYLVEDASGAQELWYNSQGEVSKVVRTLIVNEVEQPTFVSEYQYDSWGRLKTAVYPDGELVEYTFTRGGQINSLLGEKEGRLYEYVRECRYDKFGDRLFIGYGNGTSTTYPKATNSNRFAALETRLPGGTLVAQQRYTYDALGHLMTIRDDTAPSGSGGRRQEQTFAYDAAYRLTAAQGTWEGSDKTAAYDFALQQDDQYNPRQATLLLISAPADTSAFASTYVFEDSRPHFPSKIGDWTVLPNPDGNQQERSSAEAFRLAQYDEEGRLTALSDNGYLSRYSYDAAGQRAIKSHGPGSGLSLDATPLGAINHGERDYTLYVSPFLEITNDSFLKHYYLDDVRITSKKGTGYFVSQLLPPAQQITAGNIDLADRLRRLRELLLNFTEALGVPPGHPSLPFFYVDGGEEAVFLPQLDASDPRVLPPLGWPAPAGPPDPSGPPGHPVWYAEPTSPANAEAGYGYTNPLRTPEVALFYYHYNPFQDLLQVTGTAGTVLEQWAYLPFGGVFATDETATASPYQAFRNYTLDAETDLYFSGTAYYDATDLLWLNFGPRADETPHRSPYLFGNGQAFPGSDWPDLLSWATENYQTMLDYAPTVSTLGLNEGGGFSEASYTITSGPQAGAVEVAAAEAKPKASAKTGTPGKVDSKARRNPASGSKNGVVGNQGLLALRRQFRFNGEPEKLTEATDQPDTTPSAATKLKYRRFTIAPGDWDGVNVRGNRYFQFKPTPDTPVTKKNRRATVPPPARSRSDRL